MNLIVSGVSTKEDRQLAYVRFEDGDRYAEGIIPECKIIKQNGFSEKELSKLEDYMKENLTSLKKEAAKINPFSAIMNS